MEAVHFVVHIVHTELYTVNLNISSVASQSDPTLVMIIFPYIFLILKGFTVTANKLQNKKKELSIDCQLYKYIKLLLFISYIV